MPSWPPKKNATFTLYLPILDADGDPVAAAAGLSGVRSIDGGAFAATAVPVDEGEGFYSIALTAADMNGDQILVILKTTTTGAKNTAAVLPTVTRQIDDLSFPVVSGRGIDVDTTGGVEITVNQSVNVAQWLGVAPSALNSGSVQADVQRWLNAVPNALLQGRVQSHAGTAVGTADSGTTTTVVDAERTEADSDYWKGALVMFTSGTLAGQTRLVTAFDPATDTITFAPAATVAVATHTYVLLPAGRADVHLWLGALVNALIAGRLDANAQVVGDKTGYSLVANAVDAAQLTQAAVDKVWSSTTRTLTALGASLVQEIWDRATSLLTTVGSIGKLLVDNVNATVSSRAIPGDLMGIVSGGITSAKFAASAIDAAAIATDAIGAAKVSQAAANKIGDSTLRRSFVNARTSADGDAVSFRSLLGAIAKLVNKISASGTTLTIFQEDDITSTAPGGTQTLTTDAAANHITAADTN